jgi:hypothetical protein
VNEQAVGPHLLARSLTGPPCRKKLGPYASRRITSETMMQGDCSGSKERFGARRGCWEADGSAYAEFFDLKTLQGQEGKALLKVLLEMMDGSEATLRGAS